MRKHWIRIGIFAILALIVSGCKNTKETASIGRITDDATPQFIDTASDYDSVPKEDLYMLVEGAVDAWFFENMRNFKSYDPVIRKTEYRPETDTYIHNCRFRETNEYGGVKTINKVFEVSLRTDFGNPNNPITYNVVDITPKK